MGRAILRSDQRPPSAIPETDGLIGLAGLGVSLALVVTMNIPTIIGGWAVLLSTALPMLALELRRTRVAENRGASPFRLVPWVVGFAAASAPLLLVAAQHRSLIFWLTAWIVAAPAVAIVFVMERKAGLPAGGQLAQPLGQWLLRRGPRPPAEAFRQWGLKGFFIPLYGVSMLMLINSLSGRLSPLAWIVTLAFTIDLTFGLAGYIFATKASAGAIRSTQPSLLGWVVCLLCYGPVFSHWGAAETMVQREIGWPALLTASPAMAALTVGLLVLLTLYIWATVAFGLRFSNLSNRGTITHGPYRWMKHPAYFAHVGNSWLLAAMLFIRGELGWAEAIVPLAFTVAYRLRSVTEERHMSEDAAYREYAAYIEECGLLALVRRGLLSGRRLRAS